VALEPLDQRADERPGPEPGREPRNRPGAAMLETAAILPSLWFEITRRTEGAGRPAIAVRAAPIPSERDLHLPSGLHGS
jgi:hypothetical protein